MGASSGKNKNIDKRIESKNEIFDIATNSSSNSVNYNYKKEKEKDLPKNKFDNNNIIKEVPENLEQINEDLKKILFLYIQSKELKKIIYLKDQIVEADEFYLVNESLNKMNINYNIGKIFEYLNNYSGLKDLNFKVHVIS